MRTANTKNRFIERNFPHYASADFHRKMEEGLKRAPQERTLALKEFWSWFTKAV